MRIYFQGGTYNWFQQKHFFSLPKVFHTDESFVSDRYADTLVFEEFFC